MKLHVDAPLSLNQRRRLARGINEGGWSLGQAAEAAETSQRNARKCPVATEPTGRPGCAVRKTRCRRKKPRSTLVKARPRGVVEARQVFVLEARVRSASGL